MDSLRSVLAAEKEDSSRVKILNDISYALFESSAYQESISEGKKALQLAAKINYRNGLILASENIANGYYYLEQYETALTHYKKALQEREDYRKEHPKDSSNIRDIGRSCIDVGIIYDYMSDYPRALEYYFKSLNASLEVGYRKGMPSAYGNIAGIYEYQGDYDKALTYVEKALTINREFKRMGSVGINLNNIGNIYLRKGNVAKALDYHLQSFQIRNEVGERMNIAASLNNIGNVYMEFLKLKKDTLVQLFPDRPDLNKEFLDSTSLYLEKSFRICEEEKNDYGMMLGHRGLGDVAKGRGFGKEALSHYLAAAGLGKKLNTSKELFEIYRAIAGIYTTLGDYKNAFTYEEMYANLKDTVFNDNKKQDLGRQEAAFEYQKELISRQKEQEKRDALALEELKQQRMQRNYFIAGFALMILLSALIFRSYRQKQKANAIISEQKEEVIKQKNLVEARNKEVHDSITYAKRIQTAILPSDKMLKHILPDSFVLFKPKDIVSGDFYWIEKVGGKILFAVVDCTGHGVPGALVSVVGHNALNRVVKEFGLTKPAEILDKLSELVEETFSKSDSEVKDGMDISLSTLDINTQTLEWAGANNPLWISRNGEIIKFRPDKQPIGKFETRKPFSNHSFQLVAGDCIFLFTDGYADQFGGPEGKKFMYKRLEKHLLLLDHSEMMDRRLSLENTFEDWKGNQEQIDDLCLISVRIS
ncbi:MAG: tetratricopeptide repeat protein [Bacteroidota bacterium]|nr:tetratricopeptide repeat protein [Bacteroidota bacterium]